MVLLMDYSIYISLRQHYLVQVLRVDSKQPSSQPGHFPSSPRTEELFDAQRYRLFLSYWHALLFFSATTTTLIFVFLVKEEGRGSLAHHLLAGLALGSVSASASGLGCKLVVQTPQSAYETKLKHKSHVKVHRLYVSGKSKFKWHIVRSI
jgi:hypothetical protein